jgi:hypothetical protein
MSGGDSRPSKKGHLVRPFGWKLTNSTADRFVELKPFPNFVAWLSCSLTSALLTCAMNNATVCVNTRESYAS